MTPESDGYRFEGKARITPLIRGLIPTSDLQQWWPQRGTIAFGTSKYVEF